MKTITERIKYLPAAENPLSADVYLIDGDTRCFIYDVGNNDCALYSINEMKKDRTIILSHYHRDHVGNIDRVDYRDLYVGQKTYETIGKGRIVEDTITINDGVKIEIIPCTSPHTDGSLIVNVDNEYTLIADLFFTRPPVDLEKARKMIHTLQGIQTKYFVISHREDEKIVPKEKLIAELLDYFHL